MDTNESCPKCGNTRWDLKKTEWSEGAFALDLVCAKCKGVENKTFSFAQYAGEQRENPTITRFSFEDVMEKFHILGSGEV